MTRRNNEERLGMPSPGAKHAAEAPPVFNSLPTPEQSPQENSLSYVSPTELVELPSQGKLYPEDHPLHGVKEIELKEMTAKEEDLLTTESLIKKGVVFDRLLKNLLVDKSIKIDELLVGDKNALLIAARISGYGNMYPTGVSCPVCGDEDKDYEFDLAACPAKGPIDLEKVEDKEIKQLVSEGEAGKYFITLPKSRVTVEVKLLTSMDEVTLNRTQEMKRKKKLPVHPLTDHLKRIIVSVNGVTDYMQIESFVETMPASDSRFFRKAFSQLTPNIELKQDFVCRECEYEQELEVPFSTRFFWPDS